jgi:hypothetical protein
MKCHKIPNKKTVITNNGLTNKWSDEKFVVSTLKVSTRFFLDFLWMVNIFTSVKFSHITLSRGLLAFVGLELLVFNGANQLAQKNNAAINCTNY